ncbi:MAG: DUF3089 domain-containing protein [Halioglobus sp.]
MRKVLLIAIAILALACLGLWAGFSLFGSQLFNAMLQPDHRQHADPITVPPDYSRDEYWASIPGEEGLANLAPEGQAGPVGGAEVAAFYLHPTSYLSGARWNAPLFEDSWAWEMVQRMMAGQASAFSACCDVYAPHYREATLWSFIGRENNDGLQALDLAYMDVTRAFDEFITRFADDRPFIIASHSQGTAHAVRLLAEKINNTDLRERLVGAYLVGYYLPLDVFQRELGNLPPCESATDNACVMHWATFGEGGSADPSVPHWYSSGWEYSDGKPLLCTNPLSWSRNEDRVAAINHSGALNIPARYGLRNMYFNEPSGEAITGLPAVLPQWTWAQCRDGILYVEPQRDGPFANERDGDKRDYHTRDYALFYQPVRDNAVMRSRAFLDRSPNRATAGQNQADIGGDSAFAESTF